MEHIWKLQEFCNSMAKLDTDGYEYAYLKAIVLFSPGEFCIAAPTWRPLGYLYMKLVVTHCDWHSPTDHPGLSSTSQIEKFQEKAQMELQDYVQKTYPDDTYR